MLQSSSGLADHDSNHASDHLLENKPLPPPKPKTKKESRMAYKKNVTKLFGHFCENTSAHGIPWIGRSKSTKRSVFWAIIVLFCALFFLYQLYEMVTKYLRYDTNVNIELKFESASFPAVTICNVNPYKNSMVGLIPSLQQTLLSYEKAMSHSKPLSAFSGSPDQDPSSLGPPRSKRKVTDPDIRNIEAHFMNVRTREEEKQFQTDRFQPVYTACKCRNKLSECNKLETPIPQPDKFELNKIKYQNGSDAIDTCICFYDKRHRNGWPCYYAGNWYAHTCSNCSISATCLKMEPNNEGGKPNAKSTAFPHSVGETYVNGLEVGCLCQNVSHVCVKLDYPVPIENYWDVIVITPPPVTTETPLTKEEVIFEKAQGFENMTDEVAITTKAKENLIFTMAARPVYERIKMSHSMKDIIRMCSFNGRECDLERDFKLHVDPVYGNCFVFNHDVNRTQSTNRAGPFYGLRIMVYVNTTDFLPTTESSGVRVAIHGQTEFPFPDIFGYSAPTGFVSSLGIYMKRLDRLPYPYGQCVKGFHASHYIYPGYDYNTEGCYRTCFQLELIRRCGCGDPRLPIPPNGGKACAPTNIHGRACLEDATSEMGGFHGSFECQCPQPCVQNVYGLTYSASRWPAESYVIRGCNDTHENCVALYRKNAALLEIYYEQLNYEKLKETEAYGWVNLVADFGGQLGLWLGLSVITWFEFAVLLYDFIVLHLGWRTEEQKREATKEPLKVEENLDPPRNPTPRPTPSPAPPSPKLAPNGMLWEDFDGFIGATPEDFPNEYIRPDLDLNAYRSDEV